MQQFDHIGNITKSKLINYEFMITNGMQLTGLKLQLLIQCHYSCAYPHDPENLLLMFYSEWLMLFRSES